MVSPTCVLKLCKNLRKQSLASSKHVQEMFPKPDPETPTHIPTTFPKTVQTPAQTVLRIFPSRVPKPLPKPSPAWSKKIQRVPSMPQRYYTLMPKTCFLADKYIFSQIEGPGRFRQVIETSRKNSALIVCLKSSLVPSHVQT